MDINNEECCDPSAPIVTCCQCGKLVHTCEKESSSNLDYRCPKHPDGYQMEDGKWVCGRECYDKELEKGID